MKQNTKKIALCGMMGDEADRCRWQIKGGGGPPVRGMSRSDKGCAGSGEDGKVTSGQEGLQPVAERADNFSGQKRPIKYIDKQEML